MQTRMEVLAAMSDEELLKTFLSNGGKICIEEFSVPIPMNHETSESHFAFEVLSGRSNGRKILLSVQEKFRRGAIDCLGNPTAQQDVA